MVRTIIVGAVSGVLLASQVSASELIYQPINPNFGGNPLNGPNLLNLANAQNSFQDPNADDFLFDEESTIQDFADSLNRLILASLAGLIVDEVFADADTGGLDDGINTFTTDGFSISIDTSSGDSLSVDLVDLISGESTSIQVPYF